MPKKKQEKKQDYGKKIQELREMTQEYRKNPEKFTGENADFFLNELMDIKRKQLRDPFKGKEKPSFELLLGELQNTKEDVIHQEIKKRAMGTLVEIKGDLKTDENREKIAKAINYSELYTFIVDNTAVFKSKVNFERKRKEEKAQRAGIQDAINKGNQSELDKWKTDRETKGFVTERNQLQQEGFEKGKIFQSCSAILTEMDELKKKDIRTAEEDARYLSDKALRDSYLFIAYMMTTRYIRKNSERDLYDEKKMQEALEKSQKQLNKQAALMKEIKKGIEKSEKEINIDNFKRVRGQHAADMTRLYFKKFDELFHDAEISYEKKKTKNFGNVMQALGALRDYKWNENYGKNSIYEAYQERYDKGIEKALDTLDTYIQGKSRFAFLRRKLGNERLEQAQQMRELLGEIRNKMQEYRSTVKEHPMETGALMEQDDQKKKCEAEAKLVEDAVPLVQLSIEPIKTNENPILFEDFEHEQNNKKSNRENDVKVKSENEEKAGSKKQENEVKEEQKKGIQNEKENPSPKIQQTVPDVPNPRSNELMQQNSDGPKSEESQKDRKFVDVKPVVPVVQNANEKSESVEVSTAEKTDQPNTERRSTVNVPKTSKEDQRAIDTIRKSNTWSGTLQPVRAKTVSYEAVNQNRERITYDKLKSDEIKSEKNQDRKPANWVKIAHNGMKQIKEELEKQQRPYEAEDIYDSKVVSKLQEKRKALPKQK